MDPTRFDALVRGFGGTGRSRRAALKLLAAASLATLADQRLPGSAADHPPHARDHRGHARSVPGDPRTIGLACRQAVAKHVGPPYGEVCGKRLKVAKHHPPHGCCPGSSCLRGTPLAPVTGNAKGRCYCDDGYHESGDGFCEQDPQCPPCVGLNVACHASAPCCQEAAQVAICIGDPPCFNYCGISCAIVDPVKGRSRCNAVPDYVAQCCRDAGIICDQDCECCGSLRCQSGRCAPPVAVCHSLGDNCDDGEPCCAEAGTCSGGRCCLADGDACPANCGPDATCQGCCANYCRGDGQCGPVAGCADYGQPCTTSAECCNEVPCTGPDDGGPKQCRYP